MRRILLVVLLILAAGAAGYFYATRRAAPEEPSGPQSGKVQITRPAFHDNTVSLQPHEAAIPTTGDPVAHTLEALLATADDPNGTSAIPKGTKLLSVNVDKGMATVNLSAEFDTLNRQGDTGESLAYNALRKALAQFPQIERMRVMVEGKTFEGEHSGDWSDIPVRDEKTQTGSDQ